jgi:exosortase
MISSFVRSIDSTQRTLILLASGLAAISLWAYWPTFAWLIHEWTTDPQYSHGYLVPVFSVVLLWLRRGQLQNVTWQMSWWGISLLALAGLMRVGGAYVGFDYLDGLSLLPCLAGLFFLFGGWAACKWALPSIGFLFFMVPLPFQIAHGLSGPLQTLATKISAYAMQTLGLPALPEGNTILLNNNTIAVAEACSGLSMLFVFLALSTAMFIVLRRPLLDRLLILASAIPIALVANAVRITSTGIAYELLGQEAGDLIFHDLSGWLMMPLALGLLWLELKLLDLVLVAPPVQESAPALLGAMVAPNKARGEKRDQTGPKNPQVPLVPRPTSRSS